MSLERPFLSMAAGQPSRRGRQKSFLNAFRIGLWRQAIFPLPHVLCAGDRHFRVRRPRPPTGVTSNQGLMEKIRDAIWDRGAGLDLRTLTIKVARPEASTELCFAMHPLPRRILRSKVAKVDEKGQGPHSAPLYGMATDTVF